MPVIFTKTNFRLDDLFNTDRWMCPNCGLVFDYLFPEADGIPGRPGWPRIEVDWWEDWENTEIQTSEEIFCPRCDTDLEKFPPIRIQVAGMNSLSDLREMIAQGEGLHCEFKADFPSDVDKLKKIIASFATTDGGRLFLGVNNAGAITGFADINTPEQKEQLRKRIRGLVDGITPRIQVKIDFFTDDSDKNAVLITVPKGAMALYHVNSVCYIRNLDETRKATPEEIVNLIQEWQIKKKMA